MMLDILGTNRFKRDINIMNPGYIRDVFQPVYSYTVQDGMNHKIIPYPRTGSRYTPETADYFLNGVDGEPLKWGNLNSDIYVDPISLNMGTVQRQSLSLLAYDEYNAGNVEKAKGLLDISQKYFPSPNFPIDVYAVYIVTGNMRVDVVDLYKKIYGAEKARELWQGAYKYYSEELTYLSRFRADKAMGVRDQMQGDLQIMAHLGEVARRTLEDAAFAQQVSDFLAPFNNIY